MPLYALVYLEERPIAVKRIYITCIQEKIALTWFWGKDYFLRTATTQQPFLCVLSIRIGERTASEYGFY